MKINRVFYINGKVNMLNKIYMLGKNIINNNVSKDELEKKFMLSYDLLFTYSQHSDLNKKDFLYKVSDNNLFCIFCLRKKPLATFKDNAHVIPYSLGNNFLYHRQECIECNKKFGSTIETELASFTNMYRVLNGYKKRDNLAEVEYLKYQTKNQKAFIQMTKFENTLALEVSGKKYQDILTESKDGKISLKFESTYRDSDVYKALMKTIYGVIPSKYHKDFCSLREWINNDDHNFKLVSNLFMYISVLPTLHQDNLILDIYRKKRSLKNLILKRNYYDYYALVGFGNILIDIPLISDKTKYKINEKKGQFKIELLSYFRINKKEGAIRMLVDMSNTEKIKNKNSIIFSGGTKIPRSQ
ncbi:hypothetical protein WP2W18E11_31090 [Acinetobacter pittii]|uniref:HNH endonuclease 5 domain-containing protein n=2 Tax=Acinetobacter pittii TaxID=48296 RepID=A0A6S4UP45_ACIPI|nr:hypothetical protein WP2W18E11_31090 [Acinetobacter pittii]